MGGSIVVGNKRGEKRQQDILHRYYDIKIQPSLKAFKQIKENLEGPNLNGIALSGEKLFLGILF